MWRFDFRVSNSCWPTGAKKTAADAHRLIGRLVPPLRAQGLRVRPLVREELPGPLLLNTVKRMQADLAILGSHGYSRFMRFLLGSVSELLVSEAPASVLIVRVSRKVARHASCSVLVVRRSVAKGESADGLA